MPKRSTDDGLPPPKRPRRATSLTEFKPNTLPAAEDDIVHVRVQFVPFPEAIQALPHVLKSIDTLALSVDEALIEATRTHQVQWMERLLDRFECDLSDILVRASAEGNVAIVKLLLRKMLHRQEQEDIEAEVGKDTKQSVRKAVVVAAEHGHLAIITLLLPIVIGFDRHNFMSKWFATAQNITEAAAANGHLEVVKSMMQHARLNRYGGRYSFWPKVDSLSLAIQGGHLDVAIFLIRYAGALWNLEMAFVRALETHQVVVLDAIDERYPMSFPGESRYLFVDLAYSGHLDAVKYIYNNKCINGGLVSKALARAAVSKNVDVVRFLVGTGRVSSDAFAKGFKVACAGFHTIEVVKFLYSLKRVSTDVINKAFGGANSVVVIEFLLDNEKISESAVIAAFANAMKFQYIGHDKIIQFLIKQPIVPAKMIDTAFLNAAVSKCTCEALDCLRNDSRLSPKVLGKIFVDAVKAQDVDEMKAWYDIQRTPPDALVEGFIEAIHRKDRSIVKEIVNLLAVKEHVPVKCVHQAFVAAARHGQMALLKLVHEIQPVELPLPVLKSALDVAGGNEKIQGFIRKIVCDQVFHGL